MTAAFAADGIDELLCGLYPRRGTPEGFAAEPRTVHVRATDVPGAAWSVFLGDPARAERGTEPTAAPDCVYEGTARDLYLALWNRLPLADLDSSPGTRPWRTAGGSCSRCDRGAHTRAAGGAPDLHGPCRGARRQGERHQQRASPTAASGSRTPRSCDATGPRPQRGTDVERRGGEAARQGRRLGRRVQGLRDQCGADGERERALKEYENDGRGRVARCQREQPPADEQRAPLTTSSGTGRTSAIRPAAVTPRNEPSPNSASTTGTQPSPNPAT